MFGVAICLHKQSNHIDVKPIQGLLTKGKETQSFHVGAGESQ